MSSVSDLSRKYSAQVSQLEAIFPEWDQGDLAFALQDVKGNLEEAVLAITEGMSIYFVRIIAVPRKDKSDSV